MKRLSRVIILVILVLPIGLVAWLGFTESGLRWSFQRAQPYLPAELGIEALSGSLFGPIKIEAVTYEDRDQSLNASEITLDWNPWGLFLARLDVDSLRVGTFKALLAAPGEGDQTLLSDAPPQVELPLRLRLGQVKVGKIIVQRGEDEFNFTELSIEQTSLDEQIEIGRIEIVADEFRVGLQGSIRPSGDFRHDLRVDWQASTPAGESVDGDGNIVGNRSFSRVRQQLSGAVSMDLTLEFRDLFEQLAWQADINATEFDSRSILAKIPALKGGFEISAFGDLTKAEVSGSLTAVSDDLGELDAEFELASLEGVDPFEGIGISSLTLRLLEGQISTSGQLRLVPELNWKADVSAIDIDPAGRWPEWPGKLSASLVTSGRMGQDGLVAEANITDLKGDLRGYPVSLKSLLQWRENGVDINRFDLASGKTRIGARGRAGDRLDLNWELNSNNLAELYPDAEGKLKATGRLGGTRQATTLKTSIEGSGLSLPGYRVATLKTEVAVDLSQLQQLDINLVAQSLELQGQEIRALKLISKARDIRADLDLAEAKVLIELEGELDGQSWQGRLLKADIQSDKYSDWRLKSPAEISLSQSAFKTSKLCLQNQLPSDVCGSIDGRDQAWKLDFDAESLPLNLFRPWLPPEMNPEGRLNGKARLDYRAPSQLQGEVKLGLPKGSVSYRLPNGERARLDYDAGELEMILSETGLNADADINLGQGDRLLAQLSLPGANLLALDAKTQALAAGVRLDLRQTGIIEAMVSAIDDLQGILKLDASVSGTLARPLMQGEARFSEGVISIPEYNLRLDRVSINAKSDKEQKVNLRLDATTRGGELTITGNGILDAAQGWPGAVRVDARGLDIGGLAKSWLPGEASLEARVDASADLKFNAPDRLFGSVKLNSAQGVFAYPLLEGEREQWEYRDAEMDMVLSQEGLIANSKLSIGDGNSFVGQFSLPQARLLSLDAQNQPVGGEATLQFQDLALVEALVPEIDQLGGKLQLNIGVDGILARPNLKGRAEVIDAAMRIPRLGLNIEQISLTGSSGSADRFNFRLDAHSGPGTISFQGVSRLKASEGWPTSISITGDNFEISKIPEAELRVSPDLKVELRHRSIDVRGDIHLPFAKLQPKDITSAARVSDDAVIIGGEQEPEAKWQITSKVNLILGEQVSFFGFGFEGQLGGRLLIEEVPGQLLRGSGEINIPEGRYRAYGQRLDIENGRLLFSGGPLTNPGLDIRATRQSNNVVSGLKVRGRLQQPQLELFSIPAMGQTDTLSYLLFGRPMEQSSGEDGAVMAKAALALGLSGGDRIARNIGDRFGLDEMRVEANDSGDQASLVVGRYLSPKLYVSYGVGLIESINSLNLRYQISEKWQLEAESGENQGADLLYTIER